MQIADRATGKDIILDIVENMRSYREELLYSTVVPTSFEVHLHPDDYARLEGIFPAIAAEARRALDEELARQNRRIGPEWLRKLTQPSGSSKPAQDGWNISFYRDENDELRPGDVLVDSRMTLAQAPEAGAGTRTRRITTARINQQVSTTSETIESPPPPSAAVASPAVATHPPLPPLPPPATEKAELPMPAAAPATSDATVKTIPPPIYATLTYEDKNGRHTHSITTPQLVIGRGGAGYWVDVRIEAAPDISREHLRLRRDAATGQFFLKDVSLYGTTINGTLVASSIDQGGGSKKDLNIEVPLPPVARIGLADMVFIEFRLADAA
jgi:hypothetical protein